VVAGGFGLGMRIICEGLWAGSRGISVRAGDAVQAEARFTPDLGSLRAAGVRRHYPQYPRRELWKKYASNSIPSLGARGLRRGSSRSGSFIWVFGRVFWQLCCGPTTLAWHTNRKRTHLPFGDGMVTCLGRERKRLGVDRKENRMRPPSQCSLFMVSTEELHTLIRQRDFWKVADRVERGYHKDAIAKAYIDEALPKLF
jgi:hypothetical protein